MRVRTRTVCIAKIRMLLHVPLTRPLTERSTTYCHGGAVFAHAAAQDDQEVVVGRQQKSADDAQDREHLQFNPKRRQLVQYINE